MMLWEVFLSSEFFLEEVTKRESPGKEEEKKGEQEKEARRLVRKRGESDLLQEVKRKPEAVILAPGFILKAIHH
ncbi:hypothetical protein VNO77_03600 [Canavalia gladiata]|uniref:Uncharacterized protein n=1 Tax=Canavalia gladiata TaxID=3824 RepID=A0AAN9MVT7_CANGL